MVNERGAGFFASQVAQSVARNMSDQEAAEVVEVGEVGLLENGEIKRLDEEENKDKNDDPLCGTPGHAACRSN